MKKTATLDHQDKEGHGSDEPRMGVSKGTFIAIGSEAPLKSTPTSVNRKSGKDQSDQF